MREVLVVIAPSLRHDTVSGLLTALQNVVLSRRQRLRALLYAPQAVTVADVLRATQVILLLDSNNSASDNTLRACQSLLQRAGNYRSLTTLLLNDSSSLGRSPSEMLLSGTVSIPAEEIISEHGGLVSVSDAVVERLKTLVIVAPPPA